MSWGAQGGRKATSGTPPLSPRAAPGTHPRVAGEGPGPRALLGRGPCPHGGVPTAGERIGRCSRRALLPAPSWRSRRGIRTAPALPPEPAQPPRGKLWSQVRASGEHLEHLEPRGLSRGLAEAEQAQKHPGDPALTPRATPSAVRAPDTAVPTSLGGQSLGVALEEQHIWAAVPRWIPLPALGLGVTRQLHHIPPSPPPLPDLLQGLLELPKGLRLVPLEQPPELLHHSQPLLQEGAAAPLQLPQPLQEKRSHLGLPRAPSSSCRALPKGSAQAGCPGSSCQGGTTPALMHIGKELRFGRSVPRNTHPSLKPCLLLCPSQIQLSLSLPGLPRDILACRQSPQSAYSYKGGFPNKFF